MDSRTPASSRHRDGLSAPVGEERRSDAGVTAALVVVQLLFAGHYLAAKLVLDVVPAKAWAVLRILPAAALVLAVAYSRGIPRLSWRDLRGLATYALFGVVLNQIFFVEGLARTTPAHSALLNTTIPIATILFATLLGRERPTLVRVAGMALAFVGALVLLRVDRLELQSTWFRGDILTMLNAASFGLFLVLSKPAVVRIGATSATAGILAFGSLGIAAAGSRDLAHFNLGSVPAYLWTIAAFIILFATVLPYFLNAWALARVESSRVAIFVYLQPVIATALSAGVLGEKVTVRFYVSSALVFAGVFLATRSAPREKKGGARDGDDEDGRPERREALQLRERAGLLRNEGSGATEIGGGGASGA